MNLSKHICKTCIQRYRRRFVHVRDASENKVRTSLEAWGQCDEDRWRDGRVRCSFQFITYIYRVDGVPPDRCKYHLEHLVEWAAKEADED